MSGVENAIVAGLITATLELAAWTAWLLYRHPGAVTRFWQRMSSVDLIVAVIKVFLAGLLGFAALYACVILISLLEQAFR
jgi:hypothetical protein